MARTGKKIFDLTNMNPSDVMKLNEKELRKVVSQMSDAANKRVKRFEERGETSPAINAAKAGGKFTTKGLDLNKLRAEYARTRDFLTSKTSTQKGWNKIQNDTVTKLAKSEVNISKDQFNDFWKVYNKLKESHPEVSSKQLRYEVLKKISDEMPDARTVDIDAIVSNIENQLTEIYEASQENMTDDEGVSRYFDIE